MSHRQHLTLYLGPMEDRALLLCPGDQSRHGWLVSIAERAARDPSWIERVEPRSDPVVNKLTLSLRVDVALRLQSALGGVALVDALRTMLVDEAQARWAGGARPRGLEHEEGLFAGIIGSDAEPEPRAQRDHVQVPVRARPSPPTSRAKEPAAPVRIHGTSPNMPPPSPYMEPRAALRGPPPLESKLVPGQKWILNQTLRRLSIGCRGVATSYFLRVDEGALSEVSRKLITLPVVPYRRFWFGLDRDGPMILEIPDVLLGWRMIVQSAANVATPHRRIRLQGNTFGGQSVGILLVEAWGR